MKQQKQIIRGRDSGVFYGTIKERNGQEVTISNARCLWYWSGANSLNDLALYGVTRPKDCKFTVAVPELTILDAIEISPCSDEAAAIIDGVEEWRA